MGKRVTVSCEWCEQPFERFQSQRGRFCSRDCHLASQRAEIKSEILSAEYLEQRYVKDRASLRTIAAEANCTDGVVARALDSHGIQRRRCGRQRILQRRRTRSGYIQVLSLDHPQADRRGYVLEHRLVMERVLGRYLQRTEVVHHKNEKRDDNRVENLEVMSGHREHAHLHAQQTRAETASRVAEWIALQGERPCACGCDAVIRPTYTHYRQQSVPKFLRGHNMLTPAR